MANSDDSSTSKYDEIFFSSKPAPDRHIDRLSILAQLNGLEGATLAYPRVLEIGCSTGTNVISLAYSAPHAHIVGIDSSKKQIEEAQSITTTLGLSQVRFECMDVHQLSASFGTFDYIICHGLFSWVSSETQHAVLRACEQCLSERGVVFLSFNAQPGWSLRGSIAAWLRACPQHGAANQAVEHAKQRLELLKQVQVDDYSPSGIVTRDAINHLIEQSPALFTHEVLSPLSSSLSLLDFTRQAGEFGFAYLADSGINHLLFFSANQLGLSAAAAEAFQEIESNIVLKEQMWDLLYPRALRKVLLCRKGTQRTPISSSIRPDWYVAAPIHCPSGTISLSDHTAVPFESARGGSLEVTEPLLKASLSVLSQKWPLPMTLTELCSCTEDALSQHAGAPSEPSALHLEKLSEMLFPLFVQGYVELTLSEPQFGVSTPDHPKAHPLARLQSNTQSWVSNYRNEYTVLNNIERSILTLLDGTKTRAELKQDMQRLYDSREIILTASDEEVNQCGGLEALLSQLLDETLESFGKAALLTR